MASSVGSTSLPIHPASSGDQHHEHHHKAGDTMACCSHHNVKIERWLVVYLIGGVLLVATLVMRYLMADIVSHQVAELPALIGAILLGMPLFVASWKEVTSGRASTSTLCSVAILGALAIGEYVTAGFLAFILLVADQVVRQRAWGAERAIEDLVARTPDIARVVRDNQEHEVSLSQVKLGDIVRVRPGENLPVDGVVVTGRTAIDQAALTGEAIPHEVAPGDPVYAGTTNVSGVIELRATQVGQDTTIGKVSQLIREAESSKSAKQMMVEQVARFFVPVTLSVAFLVWFFAKDAVGQEEAVTRAISVLVVACPSALLLASPLALVASFASAARLGILIKRVNYLEEAAAVDTVVMDKTGTLTTGKFAVSRLVPADGVEGADLLQAAVNGEQHSNHPLAKSIVATGAQARIKPDGSQDFEEIHGRGIRARTSAGEVLVGRAGWIRENLPDAADEVARVESRIEGMTGVHVAANGRYLGVVGLEDKPRANARGVIARLRDLGVKRIDILTGDRLSVAERVGRNVGVDNIEAECLPEEKHQIVQDLVKSGRRVMMVGDGINDGPSLAEADIGVAMGLGGSDIAANSAGVALMNDDLSRIPFLIELSRRNRAIVAQNIAVAILVAIVGLIIAATGLVGVVFAAVYHVFGDVLVILNSFRLFRFGETFTQGDQLSMEQAASLPGRRAGSLSLGKSAPGQSPGMPATA
ncbi:MAG: cation-translocating P-type ATPase [Phycisphaeraceae bacterium]|nr:cation-translocating P-type ATPase [Phycisphaeraceae bacterium]